MPQQVRCPECDAALRVPDSLLGKNVKCPKCATTFTAEEEELAHPKGIVSEPTPAASRPRLSAEDDDYPTEEEPEETDEPEEEDRPRRGRRRRKGQAAAAVSGPALAMMVSAILGIVCNIGYMTYRVVMLLTIEKGALQAAKASGAAGPNPAAYQMGFYFGLTSMIIVSVVGVILCGIVVLGAMKMKNLQSYGLAMTASILSLLPCNCCCLLCLPFGIWSLVVLNNPRVKDAFT